MKGHIFVAALLIILVFGGLGVAVHLIKARSVEETAWRETNEARMAKYLGETVTIGGVPHTIIAAHAFTWNKQCMFTVRAYDKQTDISEAAIMALIAKAARVEK